MERTIKLVTEAATRVCGEDNCIHVPIAARIAMPKFKMEPDYRLL